MPVPVRCEASGCHKDATRYRHIRGVPYCLCAEHNRQVRLEPPLDWDDVQKMYHRIQTQARRNGTLWPTR